MNVYRKHSRIWKLTFAVVMVLLLAVSLAFSSGIYADSGSDISEPKAVGGVYQIGSEGELRWFASLVNGELDGVTAVPDAKAKLTADIDLSGSEFFSIGDGYDKRFKGSFDGDGHKITLDAESNQQYAALFGVVDGAEISDLIISGKLTGKASSDGTMNFLSPFIGKVYSKTVIENCGNLADVTNENSKGDTAGLVAAADSGIAVTGCFNKGTISGGDRVGGLLADVSQSDIKNCYNTGDITGAKAVGIGSTRSNSFTNCYSTGHIEGTSSAFSINGSKYSDFTNSYYIEGRAAKDTSDYGTPISPDDMKKASFVTTLGEDAWKADAGAADNEGYPLLKWEKVSEVKQIKLGQPDSLAWDAPKEEKDGEAYATTFDHIKASWKAVDFAEKYVLKLYYQDEAEPVYTSEAVKDTELDLTDVFGQLEDKKTGNYYFTVQAIGDGKTYLDGDESAKDKRGFRLDAKAFIQAPDGLRWNQASKAAYWHTSKDADFYEVTLYRDKEKVKDFLITSEMLDKDSGQATIYFISSMTQPGTYNYTVRAGREYKDENGVSHRGYSKESASDDAKFSESEKKTIKINSVDDWMKIVNYTNKGTEYKTEAEAQNALWSNDFELTADLDFSNLTAEQQTQVKSWGNINAMFSGSFDGKGHKVTGLTLSNGDGGLFQYVGETGTVTNLKIEAPNVLFSDNAAVLCYYNYGTISRCSVVNPNVTADHGAIIGGFASRNFGTIEDSYVQGGSFSANSDTANGHAGFVGSNFGLIQRCWTSMNVKTKSFSAGGFCGWADEMGGKAGKFVDCFALGDVSAERGWCGGFVGRVNSKEVKFTNCYSASRVTSAQKPDKAFGFVGSMSGEAMADVIGYSSFNETIPESAFENCYYLTDNTEKENPKSPVTGVAGTEMKSSGFAEKLGAEWAQNASKNDGLPYLEGVQVPEKIQGSEISVDIAIALYDKENYVFKPEGSVIHLTMDTTGNTSVFQVMEEAKKQGLLDYEYTVTAAFGSFFESINGHALQAPDGWMFKVNDVLSDVSASLKAVKDGDKLLWYQGTTQNAFQGPTWEEMTGEVVPVEYTEISSVDDLIKLQNGEYPLDGKYRLTADIDMTGIDFRGIGAYDGSGSSENIPEAARHPFSGEFDGAGHIISNLKINRPADHNVGFFNFIRGAKIHDLTMENADITGLYSVGGIVGVADVKLDGSNSENCVGNIIGRCRVTGKVKSANTDTSGVSKGSYTGGIIGFNNGDTDSKTGISIYSSVDQCVSEAEVTGGAIYVGGLAGGNYGYITDSHAKGNVTGDRCAGGFVGGNNGSVINCSAEGDVAGADDTGGFAGSTMEVVRHSFSTGNVKSSGNNSGGFAGSASGEVKECASAGKPTPGASDMTHGGFAGTYKGKLVGLDKDIQFKDNRGYSVLADGSEAGALGNMYSSTIESEQKVLDDTKVTDWNALADFFKKMYGVTLNADGTVTWPEEEGPEKTAGKLVDKLAASGKASDQSAWMICDIAMYDHFVGRELSLSDETKKAYLDYLDGDFSADGDAVPDVSSSELAKAVISLKAMGMDPAKFEISGKTYDIPAMLKEKAGGDKFMQQGIYTEPYILIALSQDESYATKDELKAMTAALLAQQQPSGGWGEIDADSPILLALKMQPQTKEIQEAVEKALTESRIMGMMDSAGAVSYGGKASSESTAQLIIALCSAGKDPDKYVKSGNTITDGLMSFYDADEGIFYHDRNKSGNPEISTEQALRALIAEMKLRKDKSLIYCFGGEKYSNSEIVPDDPTRDVPDKPDAVKIKISLSQKAGKAAKISWTSKNMKTVLERRTGSKGKWKKIKKSSANKAYFTDKTMKNGVIYYYRALPQDKTYQSDYGSSVKKAMLLKKASVKSAKWRKGKLTVKYKVPKVYGSTAKRTGGKVRVEISVSRTKKFLKGKYKTYQVASKKTFKKKLKKSKAKYVRVRVTVKAGGKTFRSPAVVRKVK